MNTQKKSDDKPYRQCLVPSKEAFLRYDKDLKEADGVAADKQTAVRRLFRDAFDNLIANHPAAIEITMGRREGGKHPQTKKPFALAIGDKVLVHQRLLDADPNLSDQSIAAISAQQFAAKRRTKLGTIAARDNPSRTDRELQESPPLEAAIDDARNSAALRKQQKAK